MAESDTSNRKSNMEKAEGDREPYEERGDEGISNRPIDEEIENQERVPERGQRQPGAHAG
jgi:hypothetical protein